MLRFCSNLNWMFNEHSLLERFDAAARAGFDGVEMLVPYDAPAPAIASRLRDAGLKQVLINSPSGDRAGGERGLACLPGRVQEFRDSVKLALDYASTLDCKLINILAGIRPPEVPLDEATILYATNLSWALEQANGTGIRFIIEPVNQRDMPGYLVSTQEQGASIIAALGQDRVGLQFDCYHCQSAQGDLTRRLEEFMPIIAHIQIADVPGRNEPGTGEVNWEFVFRRIQELGYQGWIGCEYRPLHGSAAGMTWRKRYAI